MINYVMIIVCIIVLIFRIKGACNVKDSEFSFGRIENVY